MAQEIDLKSIRNIGIIAHIDAGKTTLTERFLYYSGKTHRLGNIDSGNTVMDYLDEERNRGITIVAAAASFNWASEGRNSLIHLIDTPGHIDFTAEVERSLRVTDGAVVIFSGVEGVEAQSEKVWRQSDHYNVPKLAFINKLDRMGASFSRTLDEMRNKFTQLKISAFQIPVGIESGFEGVIDLLEMKLLKFEGEEGEIFTTGTIPEELLPEAEAARDHLLTDIAELSDEIAELYLEEQEIPLKLMKREIRRLVGANELCPVFLGSAKKNIGVQPVLNAILDYLPSPEERFKYPALNVKNEQAEDITVNDPHFCGLVFKLVAGGSADLLYLRTYSGKLKLNDTLINTRTGEKVRIKRMLRLYAKSIEAIEEAGPGDIIGVIGPANTFTGDTICSRHRQVMLEKIDFPEPVISIAIEPRSAKDKDRLQTSLDMICREDPTLSLKTHENTGQVILSGMGELHLEINTNRIKNEFNVEARYGKPRVAFRETITSPASVTGIFNKMVGDSELYAEVDIDFIPAKMPQGIEVISEVAKGDMPGSWLLSAAETLDGGLRTGGNSGYSLIYIKAVIKALRGSLEKTTDGSVAGAVLDAVDKVICSGTKLLEPLMKLDITAPEEVIGEITGYLQVRRAIIHGIENIPGGKMLHCEVPLAEMFGFSSALPKLSGGRAAFSMEPFGYQEISQSDLERLGANTSVKF
ncbi:elongation factor G [Lentisphaerota bacterium ZTH]|nr:elongation factor G [Lentisphaerota bacterium]WET05947.1 elongation factor G [Lentisphaerota bacterium ZTH]